jgi:hypothetical protein
MIQRLKELQMKKLIIKIYKEEKIAKMKRDQTLRKLEQSKRRRAVLGEEHDDRVDQSIFSCYDDKFLKYYENKLGITNESVNPFVTYTMTDNDYEGMFEKMKQKSYSIYSGHQGKSTKRIKKNSPSFYTPERRKHNNSVVYSQNSQELLPSIKTNDARDISLSESKKNLILEKHFELLKNIDSHHNTTNVSRASVAFPSTDYGSNDYSVAAEKQKDINGKTMNLIFRAD